MRTDEAGTDGKPFLFDDLFDVGTELTMGKTGGGKVPALVIDDFLKHPERVRQVVGSMPAGNWKHQEGGCNFVDYYDCRLRFPVQFPNKMVHVAHEAIKAAYSVDTRPASPNIDVNWFMQIHEKRADFAVPHSDMGVDVNRSFTCIVYLNRSGECSGGTAFFRFKKSGSLVIDPTYVDTIVQDPRIAETGRDYWPHDPVASWEKVGSVEMAAGRLLIFPSEYFHAAYHPQDSFFEFPRLTLAFWMVS